MKQEMGLFASKNEGVDKECVDPFTFTLEIANSLVSQASIPVFEA